ncbi:dynein axonemal light chain 4 isoform X1 [Pteropus medius]|uniref:dynein light chain 4, axonemal isoform X1 n=1 Tax=Pteropus vampyrus TaxID=132908 RepID=UPI00196ABA2C|nr:dynein light chain 4, axonemal isoform X1 [Pteropus giganteus]XP_039733574.1 dynein light chain 4, axonemal isoform X1 [Pteropus giganteus]
MGEAEGKKDEADYKRLQTFPLVRHSDMPEEMRVETMELCVTACEKFSNNNESAAKMIKETMDKKFGSSWHVVIGEGFGFEITHEGLFLPFIWHGEQPQAGPGFLKESLASVFCPVYQCPEPCPVCESVDISTRRLPHLTLSPRV